MTNAAREAARVAVVSNNRVAQSEIQTRVRNVIQAWLAAAGLDTGPSRLTITWTNVGAADPGTAATINIQYNCPLWIGQTLLQRDNLPLRSTFSTRNE